MFLDCRKLHNPDPFQTRAVFKISEVGGEAPKTSKETADKVTAELGTMGLSAKATEIVAKINEMEAAGKWDKHSHLVVDQAIAQLREINKLPKNSQEYKDAMKGFDTVFEDLELDQTELGMLDTIQRQIDNRLALLEGHKNKLASYVYLKDGTGRHLQLGEDSQIGPGSEWTIDFGGNTAAERTVGLASMIPAQYKQIRVTKADRTTVNAYRRQDGKFYSQDTSRYVSVFSGDKIQLLSQEAVDDAVASAEEEEEAEQARRAELAEAARAGDAAATFEAARVASVERVASSFTAQETRSEFYLTQAQELDKKSDVNIPSELSHLSNIDYSRDLRTMDYGDQVWRSLENLTAMSEEKSEIDYWKKIRGDFSSENIRFDKICRVTHNESSSKYLEDYKDSKVDVEALNRAEQRLGELEPGLSDDQKRVAVLDAMETEEQRVAFYRIEQYLFGERTPAELRDRLAQKEKFLTEAKQLMEGVEKLKPRDERFNEAAREDMNEDMKKTELLLASIFDRDNFGPLVKVSVWNKIFNPGEDRTFNMQLYAEKADYVDRLNMVMSESAAFRELRADFMDVETGAINKQGLLNKLKELRDLGAKRAAMGTDVAKDVGDPEAYISAHPLPSDLFENPGSLSATDQELIRLGMALNKGLEFKLQEQEAFEALKNRHSDFADGVIDGLKEYGFTAQEAATAAERVDQHIALGIGAVHSEYTKTVLPFDENGMPLPPREVEHTESLAWGLDGNIDLGKGVNLHIGIANDNLLQGTFFFHQGVSGQVKLKNKDGTDGRVGIGLVGGLQESTKGIGVGAGADISIDLGKYKQYALTAGAGAAVNPFMAKLVGFGIHGGLNRNLSGAFERKTNKASEEVKSTLDAQSVAYKEELIAQGLSAEAADALVAEMASFVQTNLDDGVMKDMNGFQFLGVGVGWTPGLPPIPYLAFSIAKKRHVLYSKPQDRLLTEVADSRIQETIAQNVGGEVSWHTMYISTTSQINENGMKTMTEAYRNTDLINGKLEQYNAAFKGQGINLVPVQVEGKTRIQLQVNRVDGGVNVYTDPQSGIETYLGENGEIFLNVDAADQLTIRRVDEFYPFIKHDGTQETRVYISNNEQTLGSVIERDSAAMIRYVELLGTSNKKVSKPELVQLRERLLGSAEVSEGEVTFRSKADLMKVTELEDLFEDTASLSEARAEMAAALGSREKDQVLSKDTKEELDVLAKGIVEKNKLDYRTISTVEWSKARDEVQYAKLTEMILASDPERTFSNAEITYMHQALMVESLSILAKGNPELIKHMYEWNKTALEQGLKYKGMSAEMAKNISEKVIAYYTGNAGLENLNSPRERIEAGAILQIQVGTLGVKGYREAFHVPTDDATLVGAMDLTRPDILQEKFLFTAEEASAFLETFNTQLSPLSDKPAELFQSQLGLAVLDASDILFGAEDTKKLAKVVVNPALATDPEYSLIFNRYKSTVNELRAHGRIALANGMLIETYTYKRMGFYDKCKNFAFTMREAITIRVPQTPSSAQKVKAAIVGRPNVKFIGIGVAATVKSDSDVHGKPPPPPPEPEEPTPSHRPQGFETAGARPGDVLAGGGGSGGAGPGE
ncbi:MAG: hypothetical protein AAB802_04315 [Patescibacteria group bacterium]